MLEEALELARNNEIEDLPKMAAIISKRKRIISTGLNSRKTHPMMQRFTDNYLRVCLHAEMAAINNAIKSNAEQELQGADIFVARITKSGEPAIAKPCPICQKALDTYGIAGVYWTEYE